VATDAVSSWVAEKVDARCTRVKQTHSSRQRIEDVVQTAEVSDIVSLRGLYRFGTIPRLGRHGARPRRSARNSRKTLTLGDRCRPGGSSAHNG
jgi:hypothetical protein